MSTQDLSSLIKEIGDSIGGEHILNRSHLKKVETLPSEIETIDLMMEGGLPVGLMTEMYGPEASGKTTTALQFIVSAQKRGWLTYFIDAEFALDIPYASRMGVDVDKLQIIQPESAEHALEVISIVAKAMCSVKNSALRAIIVLDSIAALVPRVQIAKNDKEGFESSVIPAARAALLSNILPALIKMISKAGIVLLFLNQEREKIGVVYGSPTTQPGGRTVKFLSSQRYRISKVGLYQPDGSTNEGVRSKIIPVKSKNFPIWNRECEIIITKDGIDREVPLIEAGLAIGVITKSGAWYKLNGQSFQGLRDLLANVRTNPELKKFIGDALNG